MVKKAVIVIVLVDESKERSNKELEREILEELVREPTVIPWMKDVEKWKLGTFSAQFHRES